MINSQEIKTFLRASETESVSFTLGINSPVSSVAGKASVASNNNSSYVDALAKNTQEEYITAQLLQSVDQSSCGGIVMDGAALQIDGHYPEVGETCSDVANEPVTPTDSHQIHELYHESQDTLNNESQVPFISVPSVRPKSPLLLNTAPTPPTMSPAGKNTDGYVTDQPPPQNQSQTGLTSSGEPSAKRGFSKFFRRSNSYMSTFTAMDSDLFADDLRGSEAVLRGRLRAPSCGTSASTSSNRTRSSCTLATTTSDTTRSNSPSSLGFPCELTIQHRTIAPDPALSQFFNTGKKNRSSTGIGLRNKLHSIKFAAPGQDMPHLVRHRAASIDLETGTQRTSKSSHPELTRHPWGFPAEAGTGLKARHMSFNLSDDFTVDFVELHTEFADQSKIIGRRGKTLGKSATSAVRLMTRRGDSSELYAVKELRRKQPNEKEQEYEKKVKSEYSIAKSLHHPNIVETIRLCTHQGRWSHVMEYCQDGDLFGLVQKGYLTSEDRLTDRLCIFKQLVQGVHYLHNHGIAHRDIKLENILVTSQSKLKITDFGVSEVFSGIHPGLRAAGGECEKDMKEVRLCAPGICGGMPYIAPEVVVKTGKSTLN